MITNRLHFEMVDSTNKEAREIAEQGCEHGTLVTAEGQKSGIGRRGRSWSSEKGAGIYMSMVLRPMLKTEQAPMLTLVAAIAVKRAIEILCDGNTDAEGGSPKPYIKWPNDIVLNKKKICGILTELSLKGTEIDFIIVGIGINVRNQFFPEEIAQTASSILLETGKILDRERLIAEVWKQFDIYYQKFMQTKDLSLFREEYEETLISKEENVKVLDPLGEYTGVAKGITNTGELIVDKDGEICYVSSGEVSVRGIYGYV